MSVAAGYDIQTLINKISEEISLLPIGESPSELYEPIRYILSIGGKKMRPLLAALSYQMYKDNTEEVLRPLLAIEVFHNFTLMHDDIMDKAPLRRGKPTVHEKWNENIAILSGDVMLVRAYSLLLDIQPNKLSVVLKRFSETAAQVCEGQQWDMNYETQNTVSVENYIEMIRLKTAVLLGFSLELGAILADAPPKDIQLLYDFGVNIGLGFQLKDDLLDVYGDAQKFGKQVGGDIASNKKTYLLISALNKAQGETAQELHHWLSATCFDKIEKVKAVTHIYDNLGIKANTEKLIQSYFDRGFQLLEKLSVPYSHKQTLIDFTKQLIDRES